MTGEELRDLRLALGLTQVQMGGLLGVHRNTIRRYEVGERRITAHFALFVVESARRLAEEREKEERQRRARSRP